MRTVLRGGRVCDPAKGTDELMDVLIADGTIQAVGSDVSPSDAEVVDVTGLIVGPGFVDLHSHVHSVAGHRLQAMDGVTTAMDLEAGLMPVRRAYEEAASAGRPLHYGFSASWAAARAQVLNGRESDANLQTTLGLFGDVDWQRSSSPRELATWLSLLETELSDGALGIGVLLGYAPQTPPEEFLAVARLAAAAGVPTYTHVRELVEVDPATPVDGSEEIALVAAETGTAMHHCHVNSTSGRHIDRVLATIDRVRSQGARVTIEAYPYGAGATAIGASFLDPERLAMRGVRPSNIIVAATGESIADASRLRELRALDPGAACIVQYLDERDPEDLAMLHRALAFPDSIVASDAMPVSWPDRAWDSALWPLPAGAVTHPRTAGTFTRSLRVMVRETGAWTWPEAFRRCSYLPARVLDGVAAGMRRKGHLSVGADADIVVIDPETVTDTATYADPTRPAKGVRHLLVGGTFVVRDGEVDPGGRPGQAVRGTPSS